MLRARRLVMIAPIAGLALLAGGCQERLIHQQRAYRPEVTSQPTRWLPPGSVTIAYDTDQGAQTAFWVPPRTAPADRPPERIWMAFSGNGGLALEWHELVSTYPGDAGFLLFDYPGHGANAGTPDPATIRIAAVAAQAALAKRLGLPGDVLAQRTAVLCHSLGCATGLEFAAAHPVRGAVLIAPFTTMAAEVRHLTCWFLALFLTHRYDNTATLARLVVRTPPPPVTIIHGERDEMIPIAMGRELAAAHLGHVRFLGVPEAGHNDIIGLAAATITAEMLAIDRK